MKSLVKIFAVIIALNITSAILPKQASAQQDAVNSQFFYDQLSPYGQWVDYPNYGYVWFPNAGPDFVPYSTGGYWVLTDDGWMWVSDYDWGWAPFHYGRWDYDNAYGWFWVPDNVWGPSWVTWREGNGYYGWAPMRPGVSIDVSIGGSYNVPGDRWTFVRDRDIRRRNIGSYRVDQTNNITIINNTTVINRVYNDNDRHARYVAGPDGNDVQRATGKPIKLVAIQESNKPGQIVSHGQMQIYRPQVQSGYSNGQKPAPSGVVSMKDVKPPRERTVLTQPRKANLAANQVKRQRPQTVNPPSNNRVKQQPSQPRMANPAVNRGPGQQRQTGNPPNKKDNNKDQPSQPRPRQEKERHD